MSPVETTKRGGSPGRMADLDVLRALAVFLVLGRHILLIPENLPAPIGFVLGAWHQFGWIGVDMFFTLSGFLVSGLLFREYQTWGRVNPVRFLVRRGLKIYPAFYAFLVISVAVSWYGGLYGQAVAQSLADVCPPPTSKRLLGELIFMQNYVGYMWGHTWSLAVEEHFYILLVALIFLSIWIRGSARPFSFLPAIALGTCALLLGLRLYLGQVRGLAWWHILPFTHLRIDSLFYGVALSYVYHFQHERTLAFFRTWRWSLVGSSLALLSPAFFLTLDDSRWMYTAGFTGLYLGFGHLMMLVVTWCSDRKNECLRRLAWLSTIGRHSYSMYLWHIPVYLWSVTLVRAGTGRHDLFAMEVMLYLAGSVLAGIGMSVLVEQPVLRIRDRLYPSKASALT